MLNKLYWPLIIFIAIFFLLWSALRLHPTQIPSPLINQHAPIFQLPLLTTPQKTVTQQVFLGHVTLLNVWASWCSNCADEHTVLMLIAKNPMIQLIGLDYKDDAHDAIQWLNQLGNPYRLIMADANGLSAIDWGVYGTPESFIIDQQGIIRYKHIGPLTLGDWQQTLLPLIQHLNQGRP